MPRRASRAGRRQESDAYSRREEEWAQQRRQFSRHSQPAKDAAIVPSSLGSAISARSHIFSSDYLFPPHAQAGQYLEPRRHTIASRCKAIASWQRQAPSAQKAEMQRLDCYHTPLLGLLGHGVEITPMSFCRRRY